MEDFLSIRDFTPEQITSLLDLAIRIKLHPQQYSEALTGKTLAMLLDKDCWSASAG